MGLAGPLPDGAAGWMVRVYDTLHGPAERWGARDVLYRLEQLGAAVESVGGRGGPEIDLRTTMPWDRDVFVKINIVVWLQSGRVTLVSVDATDSAGFETALGEWVTRATYRRGGQCSAAYATTVC